jgi:hypothetical protein
MIGSRGQEVDNERESCGAKKQSSQLELLKWMHVLNLWRPLLCVLFLEKRRSVDKERTEILAGLNCHSIISLPIQKRTSSVDITSIMFLCCKTEA